MIRPITDRKPHARYKLNLIDDCCKALGAKRAAFPGAGRPRANNAWKVGPQTLCIRLKESNFHGEFPGGHVS